jgi:hypothetical protein
MALSTFSRFYYGYEITLDNNKIDFAEGGPQLTAALTVGIYSPTNLALEIKTQLDAIGANTYTVAFSRSTRKFTISTTVNFSLLTNTGTNINISPYTLLGFTATSDKTGASTYTGDNASGYEFIPQFILQDYVHPDNSQEKIEASINESASGLVEVVSFGTKKWFEFTMDFITNLPMENKIIRNNSSGVEDAQHLMQFLIKRGNFEFMPDKDTTSTFYTLNLESTPESSKGVGYKLKELVDKDLPGFFKTGKLKFRLVE